MAELEGEEAGGEGEPEIDELVIVEDDDLKKRQWPLARITKVVPSKDGVVRVVEVRTKNGTYTRPAT